MTGASPAFDGNYNGSFNHISTSSPIAPTTSPNPRNSPKKSPKRRGKARRKDDDDDDYIPEPPRRKTKKRQRDKSTSTDDSEPPPKRARKAPRPWSVEEEEKFLKGLEDYGRDWGSIAALFTHRDKKSIRSHAQKHFVHLWFKKQPLPDEVLKSGAGYTLSGRPLQEDSSACKSYKNMTEKKKKTEAELRRINPDRDNPCVVVKDKPKRKKERKKKPKKDPDDYAPPNVVIDETSKRRNRPRRSRKSRQAQYAEEMEDEYSLLPLQAYAEQPFRVLVCPRALLLADLHAHLSPHDEIIGFLGGRYEDESKLLYVTSFHPCKSHLAVDDRHHNVEPDPFDQIRISEELEKSERVIVGWYHSHPKFAAQPSRKDVRTHEEHQTLFMKGDVSPFIGLIVGPYDVKSNQSKMTFFAVSQVDEETVPMQIVHEDLDADERVDFDELFIKMRELTDRFPEDEFGEMMNEDWALKRSSPRKKRKSIEEEKIQYFWEDESYDKVMNVDNKSRLAKIGRSMYMHMARDETTKIEFAERVVEMLDRKYGVEVPESDEDEEMPDAACQNGVIVLNDENDENDNPQSPVVVIDLASNDMDVDEEK